MTGHDPFSRVTPDNLRSIAREATAEHMNMGTNLTSAVVKAASLFGQPLTSEHVRRVCEMTYQDTFERKFREKVGGADRYISFDPPDAAAASHLLRAEKTASTPRVDKAAIMGSSLAEKVANVTETSRRFDRVNAFDQLVNQPVDNSKVAWYNPLSEVMSVQEQLKEAGVDLRTRLASASGSEKFAMDELMAHAVQSYNEGVGVTGVLHACTSGVKMADYPGNLVTELMADLALNMSTSGCHLEREKVASFGHSNPNHPLPQAFKKVADFRSERVHLEYALAEIQSEYDRVNGEIRALCH